jgi:hypothetical protein
MADGAVQILPAKIDAETLCRLATFNDGQEESSADYADFRRPKPVCLNLRKSA